MNYLLARMIGGHKMSGSSKKELLSWGKAFIFAFLIAFVIRQFLFTPVVVSGHSMEPTFHDENKIIISKIQKIHRFDMIVFHAPDQTDDYIKRVIGLPGDTVVMQDDTLYINGERYEEAYVNNINVLEGQNVTQDFTIEVPVGQLYVLGDNRGDSTDSRKFGCIDKKSVVGVVKFRIAPFKEIGVPR